MLSADEARAILLGIALGIMALLYLVIITAIRISINKRRAGSNKSSNS